MEVVRRGVRAGLKAIALTDHDTIDGVAAATAAGREVGLRVVAGCEFSVAAGWGEMHLLAYFLPTDAAELDRFLSAQRTQRVRRAETIVARLWSAGIRIQLDDVLATANGGAVGRPHVARALMIMGAVASVSEAFDRYLKRGRPGFVPKQLPPLAEVTALVRRMGGVSSAAHLKRRASRAVLASLAAAGLDAVEVRHPAHDDATRRRIAGLATQLELLPTGGSDWHGDGSDEGADRAPLGTLTVPAAWLEAVEQLHRRRAMQKEQQP